MHRGLQLYKNAEWLRNAYVTEQKSATAIANELGCCRNTISEWLLKLNIPKRTSAEYLDLAQRRDHFDLQFFREWSPPLAYVLGFAMADGSLVLSHHSAALSFCSTDLIIIERIAEAIGSSAKVYRRVPSIAHYLPSYSMFLHSKAFVDLLPKYGLVPRKSLIAEMPCIPQELIGHYVRGVFDGDGCISRMQTNPNPFLVIVRFVSGSQRFAVALEAALSNAGLPKRPVFCSKNGKGNIYGVQYYEQSAILRLYNLMYANAGDLYLPRKRNKFEEFITHVKTKMNTPEIARRISRSKLAEWSELLAAREW